MCWTGKNNFQIATEDMKVFKIFKYKHGEILSPIMPMQWKRDKLAPHIEIPYSSVLYRIINEGYHSCRNLKIVPNYCKKVYVGGSFIYPFHRIPAMYKQERFIMLTCIIPKGSEYYENEFGEIVSNQLKIIKQYKS